MNGVPGLTPPRILLLGTGGTIAMASDAGGAIKPALQADELVRAVPALERIAALETVAYPAHSTAPTGRTSWCRATACTRSPGQRC